jgi:hypothetical protein
LGGLAGNTEDSRCVFDGLFTLALNLIINRDKNFLFRLLDGISDGGVNDTIVIRLLKLDVELLLRDFERLSGGVTRSHLVQSGTGNNSPRLEDVGVSVLALGDLHVGIALLDVVLADSRLESVILPDALISVVSGEALVAIEVFLERLEVFSSLDILVAEVELVDALVVLDFGGPGIANLDVASSGDVWVQIGIERNILNLHLDVLLKDVILGDDACWQIHRHHDLKNIIIIDLFTEDEIGLDFLEATTFHLEELLEVKTPFLISEEMVN